MVAKMVALAVILLFIMVIMIPAVLVRGFDFSPPMVSEPEEGIMVNLLMDDGTVKVLPLEEYVKGVVAAEMPTSFHIEALKAQAVVARTYAVRRIRSLGGRGHALHPQADLTASPNIDQAYLSKDAARTLWGSWGFQRRWAKVEEAVEATQGLIVTHNSIVIDPVYHSTSGGHTENSEDVWGEALPYLRALPSPWDEHSPYFTDTLKISFDSIASLIGDVSVTALSNASEPLQVLEYSSTGRVTSIRVSDQVIAGTEFRKQLGLRSTRFTWKVTGTGIEFTTQGFGHGVGMSQYGADGMANDGRDFRYIIKYYYKGVEIVPIFGG